MHKRFIPRSESGIRKISYTIYLTDPIHVQQFILSYLTVQSLGLLLVASAFLTALLFSVFYQKF